MVVRLLSIGLLCWLCCTSVDLDDIENLNNGEILIIGHAGSGFHNFDNPYPENSYGSIRRAIDGMNADGVEVDVQMSADSVLILYHDPTLQSLTDCNGCICQYLAEHLLDCRYRNNINVNVFQDEKIIALEKILDHYFNYQPRPYIFLDIKLHSDRCWNYLANYEATFSRALVRIIKKYQAENWIIIESTLISFLLQIKELCSATSLMIKATDFEYALETALVHQLNGIEMKSDDINERQVATAHTNNLLIALQGVKSRSSTIDAIQKNPDIIQTDNIRLLQAILH